MTRHHIGYILPVMLVIIAVWGFYYGFMYDIVYTTFHNISISAGVPADLVEILDLFWFFLPAVPLSLMLTPFVLSNAMKEEPM